MLPYFQVVGAPEHVKFHETKIFLKPSNQRKTFMKKIYWLKQEEEEGEAFEDYLSVTR